ncbi:hypothetical protein [Nocardia sp. NPDC004722]
MITSRQSCRRPGEDWLGILPGVALTQQLARIPAELLARCRESVEALDSVCSFTAVAHTDYLDMNWWPLLLERAWTLIEADPSVLDTLRYVFDGDAEVNPSYQDHANLISGEPVTALAPHRVARIAAALRTITPAAVANAVPTDPDRVETLLGPHATGVIGDLKPILAEQHSLLQTFYEEAAHRGLAVVLWWD